MLDINPDTVCRLIDLAREFHAQEGVVIPEAPDSPADDWALQVLADHSGNSTLAEFKSIISDLEPDQQQQVVALLWIGRGDFSTEEWGTALEQAEYSWNEATGDYLIAHPQLADHLADGLEALGYSCEE